MDVLGSRAHQTNDVYLASPNTASLCNTWAPNYGARPQKGFGERISCFGTVCASY